MTGARTPKKRAKAAAGKTLKIERWFSDPKVSPFDQVEWERRTAEITDDGGRRVFRVQVGERTDGRDAIVLDQDGAVAHHVPSGVHRDDVASTDQCSHRSLGWHA